MMKRFATFLLALIAIAINLPADSVGLITQSGSRLHVVGGGAAITGLDWDGDPTQRRQVLFSSPPAAHPLTAIWKDFQRANTQRSDTSCYYTTFFWGNEGDFVWGGGYANSYYGAHPYPSPAIPCGTPKWEISVNAADYRCRDTDGDTSTDNCSPDSSTTHAPAVVTNQWYDQALTARNVSGSTYEYKFYIDLSNISTSTTITLQHSNGFTNPPSPALMFGQAPPLAANPNVSWGSYEDWEETDAILRGWQIYTAVLSQSQITARKACDTNACVLNLNTADGITSLWYLSMNPTVADISDKSGNGHNPTWSGAGRPADWTQ